MSNSYTIHDLPQAERPRERLLKHGSEALSSAELIAIILGNGTRGTSVLQLAQQLLSSFGGLEKLVDATLSELCQVKGIGKAKGLQLQSVFGICKRIKTVTPQEKPTIDSPWHVYNLLKDTIALAKQEHFIVIMQDTRGCMIHQEVVAIGTLTETLVHPREVFYPAIRNKAASILVAHNHPSGDPEPSLEDIEITEKLCEAGLLMDIPLMDHLIIVPTRFVSLRQRGLKCFLKK
ncbi:MAG: DNA repair protein RadC [Parachlamydiales bacterium]|jgi:DNA repair protein RadC